MQLEFLDISQPMCINGKQISLHSLGDPDVRFMLESIALVGARVMGLNLINKPGENAYERRILDLAREIKRKNGTELSIAESNTIVSMLRSGQTAEQRGIK
jgi:hypothetical protein